MALRSNQKITRIPEKKLTPEDKLKINKLCLENGEEKIFPYERRETSSYSGELSAILGNGQENSDIRKKMANGINVQIKSVKVLLEGIETKKHPMFRDEYGSSMKIDKRYLMMKKPEFKLFLNEMLLCLEYISCTLYKKNRSDELVTEDVIYLFSKEVKEEGLYDIFIKKYADQGMKEVHSPFFKKIIEGSADIFVVIDEILQGNIGKNKARVPVTIVRSIDMKTEGFKEFVSSFSHKLQNIIHSGDEELIDEDIFSVYKATDKKVALYNIYRKDIRGLRSETRRIVAGKIDYHIKSLKRDYATYNSGGVIQYEFYLFTQKFIDRLCNIRDCLYNENWDDSLITEDMGMLFGVNRDALPIYNIYNMIQERTGGGHRAFNF